MLYHRTYVRSELDARFADDKGKLPILISDKEFETARKFINRYGKNIVRLKNPISTAFLIEGNLVRENNFRGDAVVGDMSWCYKVDSETEKGLKDITSKMGLSLEYNLKNPYNPEE